MAPKAALLLAAAVALLLAASPAAAFVRVAGTRFVDENCLDFAFVGANT